MATQVAVLLGIFLVQFVGTSRVGSQLGKSCSSFLAPEPWRCQLVAKWGGKGSVGRCFCPANLNVLIGVCIKNGANPNPGQA